MLDNKIEVEIYLLRKLHTVTKLAEGSKYWRINNNEKYCNFVE